MAKLVIYVVLLTVLLSVTSALECPSSSKVLTCTPKCKSDNECSKIGGKCCRNICNTLSCAPSYVLSNSNTGAGYKDKYSSATGTYCGNVKCNPFEKCEMDRMTNRQRCVRG